jgi:hypothetical protein
MSIRHLAPAILLSMVLSPALQAQQPARGTVVAVTSEYLVLENAAGGRRLFVLEGAERATGLQPGEPVAVRFAVGDDAELRALSVRAERTAPVTESGPSLGRLLAVAALSPLGALGLALVPHIGG